MAALLWAQLGSNQRPPDYESYFFPFRCFPILGSLFQVIDSQHFQLSPVCGSFPLSAEVVYSNVYPAKIFLANLKTRPLLLHITIKF